MLIPATTIRLTGSEAAVKVRARLLTDEGVELIRLNLAKWADCWIADISDREIMLESGQVYWLAFAAQYPDGQVQSWLDEWTVEPMTLN